MSKRNWVLPNGEITHDPDEFADTWCALGDRLIAALGPGWRCPGFGAHSIHVDLIAPHPALEGQTVTEDSMIFSVELAERIIYLYEKAVGKAEKCAKCGKFPGTIIEGIGDLKFETPIKKFSAVKSGDRYLCFSCLDELMKKHEIEWTDPSSVTPLFTIAVDHALGNTKLCPYHEKSIGWDACSEGFDGCEIDRVREIRETIFKASLLAHNPGHPTLSEKLEGKDKSEKN